jgi:hypothetical protein
MQSGHASADFSDVAEASIGDSVHPAIAVAPGPATRERIAFVPGESFWVGEPRCDTVRLSGVIAACDRVFARD